MTTDDNSDIRVHMTSNERALLEKYLIKSRFYLEYGCGGSTELAVRLKVGRAISIESDKRWVEELSKKPEISAALSEQKLRIIHTDLGKVGDWGTPTDDSLAMSWPKYFLTPFDKFNYEFDTVLIDGRFRIACALACHAFLNETAIVMVHDYRTRDGYSEIEKFFEIIEHNDSLFVFKKKPIINLRSYYKSVITSMYKP